MLPNIALVVAFAFIFYAYLCDSKKRVPVTKALIIPFLWFSIASTRLLGVWLHIWGVPTPGGSNNPTSGSLIDQAFLISLMAAGLVVLVRRQFNWGIFFRSNLWLILLFALMLASIAWSDFQGVSIKRWIKSFGSVIMVLIVLTEPDRKAATAALIRRVAYFHLPLSIVVIRYFRDIGVNFDYTGSSVAWIGLATSKNTLGQFVITSALYFIWEKFTIPSERRWRSFSTIYLLMALYLLKGSDDQISMTSLSVFAIGAFALWRFNFYKKRNPYAAVKFSKLAIWGTLGLLLFIIIHSVVMFSEDSPLGMIILALGRDLTLTDRTVIWNEVYEVAAQSPFLGVGYGGFWIGEIANIPFSAGMTWTLGQAHNGYVDTYLHLGYVGVAMLILLILQSRKVIANTSSVDYDFMMYRLTLLIVVVFVNITESTFLRPEHNMWFSFLLISTIYTLPKPVSRSTAPTADRMKRSSAAAVIK